MLYVDFEKQLDSFPLRVKLACEKDPLALLGASGAGKSMTLKCIAGIEKPDKGVIVLNNRTLFDSSKKIDLPPQKRNVGYLFQDYALFPNMTVLENIKAGLHRKKRAEREKNALEIAARFHLEHLLPALPSKLSGGEKQRVALARILASEPEVLLLDEPFSSLDSYLSWTLRSELQQLLQEHFRGDIILVSHNIDDAAALCSSASVLEQGRSVETAPVKKLLQRPKTRSAAKLIGYKNISKFTVKNGNTILATDWNMQLSTENIPEHTGFAAVADEDFILGIGEENNFTVTIDGMIRSRAKTFLTAHLGNRTIYISTETPQDLVGNSVSFHIPRDRIIFLN